MKKILSIILGVVLVFSVSACDRYAFESIREDIKRNNENIQGNSPVEIPPISLATPIIIIPRNKENIQGNYPAEKPPTTLATPNNQAPPKTRIIGAWSLEDMIKNGKSLISETEKKKMQTDLKSKWVYVFGEKTITAYVMGTVTNVPFVWIDERTIEATTKDSNGKTEKKTSTIVVTADKLTITGIEKDVKNKDVTSVMVLKRYVGKLPSSETAKP